jgi:hypothetical protein
MMLLERMKKEKKEKLNYNKRVLFNLGGKN